MNSNCISEIEEVDKLSIPYLKRLFFRDSIDKFKITKHRDGIYPAIITISGFLTEDSECYKDWEKNIIKLYPDHKWLHVEWNNQKIPDRLKRIIENVQNKFNNNNSTTSGLYYTPYLPIFGHSLINNWWHLAIRNSKHAGKILAKRILAVKNKEFIIIGHSLGARVIFNCLEHIRITNKETNIIDVHLLGGAVNSRKDKWKKTRGTVKNKFYNYYSNNDDILRLLYSSAMIDRYPIGLKEINLTPFENVDSSIDISGHTEFIPNFYKIKR